MASLLLSDVLVDQAKEFKDKRSHSLMRKFRASYGCHFDFKDPVLVRLFHLPAMYTIASHMLLVWFEAPSNPNNNRIDTRWILGGICTRETACHVLDRMRHTDLHGDLIDGPTSYYVQVSQTALFSPDQLLDDLEAISTRLLDRDLVGLIIYNPYLCVTRLDLALPHIRMQRMLRMHMCRAQESCWAQFIDQTASCFLDLNKKDEIILR